MARRTPIPEAARDQVLALTLAGGHSSHEIAALTGLLPSTVRVLQHRAEELRSNSKLMALCALPPIRPSTSTEVQIQVPMVYPTASETGDTEIDAMLWLRAVVKTGQEADIANALEARRKLPSTPKELEDRYTKNIVKRGGGLMETLASMGFGDLEGVAATRLKQLSNQRESLARFGGRDEVLTPTPLEEWVFEALRGLEGDAFGTFPEPEVAIAFRQHPEMLPRTLRDCTREEAYWEEIFGLRHAWGVGDHFQQVYARLRFVRGLMAEIHPKSAEEALEVFEHLQMDLVNETLREPEVGILRNLIQGRR